MKKVLTVLVICALCVAFSSCFENKEAGVSSKQQSEKTGSEYSSKASDSSRNYSNTGDEIQKAREKVRETLGEITNDGMSDMQKAKTAYEWLFYHFKYRAVSLDLSNGYTDELTGEMANYYFRYHKGSCEHYAAVQKLFLDELGFETMYVEGDRYDSTAKEWGDHLWVIAKKDGKYYHVDGLFGGNHTANLDSMFFVPDEALETTHKWDTKKYPACTSEQLLPKKAD